MNEKQRVDQDDRTLAAIAHGGVLLGPLTNGVGGVIVALIIWAIRRDRSPFVRFQALQAVVYQLLGMIVWIAIWIGWTFFFLGSIFVPMAMNPGTYEAQPPASMFVALGLLCIPFGLIALWVLGGLWGALRAFTGRDFKYPIIGRLLAERM